MNSISQFFGGGSPRLPGFLGMIGNISDMISKFTQFAKNPIASILSMRNVNVPKNFDGSPEQLAKYLMNTGQMPQQQFQQFAQAADQLTNILPKF